MLAEDAAQPPTKLDHSTPYSRTDFVNYLAKKKLSFPELIDPLGEAATKTIPLALLKILSAIHAAGGTPPRLKHLLETFENYANHFENEFRFPEKTGKKSSFDPREAAFIRIVLRSTQEKLKRPKQSNAPTSKKKKTVRRK